MPHFIATYGYLAVFVLMVAESACLPVPSELVMTFAGALAAGAVPGTSLNLVAVIAAGVAGNVAGSYIAWAVGRYGGPLRPPGTVCQRYDAGAGARAAAVGRLL